MPCADNLLQQHDDRPLPRLVSTENHKGEEWIFHQRLHIFLADQAAGGGDIVRLEQDGVGDGVAAVFPYFKHMELAGIDPQSVALIQQETALSHHHGQGTDRQHKLCLRMPVPADAACVIPAEPVQKKADGILGLRMYHPLHTIGVDFQSRGLQEFGLTIFSHIFSTISHDNDDKF